MEWNELKKYVFDPLDAANAISTDSYDAQSIMVWPFPPNILLNGSGGGQNYELSDSDKEFIAQLYPMDAIVTAKTSYQQVTFTLYSNAASPTTDYTIDWGDGTVEYLTVHIRQAVTHNYTNMDEHTIRIFGNTDALYELACGDTGLSSLDVSKNINLAGLYCGHNQLTSLDVTKNVNLITLYCGHNQLTSLDVAKNSSLNYLDCGQNQLTSLDVAKNINLGGLTCWDNQLTSLDVAQNINLTGLNCEQNQLTSLDVSNNVQLYSLKIANTPLFQNQSALTALAQTLPSRVGNPTAGRLYTYGSTAATSWIGSICASKNWVLAL